MPPTKSELFLELAKPDAEGFSRKVSVDEFNGHYEGLRFGNGASWARDDGGLAKKFNIRRHKSGLRIIAVELQGYKKTPIEKAINPKIAREIRKRRCVVLGISEVEVDHKDGRRDDPRLNDPKRQTIDDFQPLSKAVNNAKRNHCKRCRETNRRFDATTLGFHVAQERGDGTYNGTCIGCYWYDPPEFIRRCTSK